MTYIVVNSTFSKLLEKLEGGAWRSYMLRAPAIVNELG